MSRLSIEHQKEKKDTQVNAAALHLVALMQEKQNYQSILTYGAITALTSGDLGSPAALSQPSSSSANLLAEKEI